MSHAARLLAAALVVLVSGCSAAGGPDDDVLTVYAAASLQAPFNQLEERFEAAHPDVDVRLAFAGSAELAAQIRQGAPADVFASADTRTMDGLGDLVSDPAPFASNTLRIAVPPGDPAGVTGLADLADPEVRTVVCAPEVPCGAAAERLAAQAGVELDPVSEEQSVTDVLGKVAGGEADAGLVYRTDIRASGGAVEQVVTPGAESSRTTYPIAAVGEPTDLADRFVAFVRGSDGREVLSEAGFGRP